MNFFETSAKTNENINKVFAFALGDEEVFCGTLFISSSESRAVQNVKEAMVKTNATDMDFFRTLSLL